MIGEGGDGGPVGFGVQQVVKIASRLFEMDEAAAEIGNERFRQIPRRLSVVGPFGDETGVIGIARVEHLGDRTGQ